MYVVVCGTAESENDNREPREPLRVRESTTVESPQYLIHINCRHYLFDVMAWGSLLAFWSKIPPKHCLRFFLLILSSSCRPSLFCCELSAHLSPVPHLPKGTKVMGKRRRNDWVVSEVILNATLAKSSQQGSSFRETNRLITAAFNPAEGAAATHRLVARWKRAGGASRNQRDCLGVFYHISIPQVLEQISESRNV